MLAATRPPIERDRQAVLFYLYPEDTANPSCS
jgi:hypothetical protein